MIRWLRDLFFVLVGRGVVVSREEVRLTAQIEVLASVLARTEPFRTESTSVTEPMNTPNSLARLRFAVAYLAVLPALFAKTKRALGEALANQMPADTKRKLEALQAELDEKNAALAEFDAIADDAAAAVKAADDADDGLPGADEGEGNPPPAGGDGGSNSGSDTSGSDGTGEPTGGTSGEGSAPGSDPLPPEDFVPPANTENSNPPPA